MGGESGSSPVWTGSLCGPPSRARDPSGAHQGLQGCGCDRQGSRGRGARPDQAGSRLEPRLGAPEGLPGRAGPLLQGRGVQASVRRSRLGGHPGEATRERTCVLSNRRANAQLRQSEVGALRAPQREGAGSTAGAARGQESCPGTRDPAEPRPRDVRTRSRGPRRSTLPGNRREEGRTRPSARPGGGLKLTELLELGTATAGEARGGGRQRTGSCLEGGCRPAGWSARGRAPRAGREHGRRSGLW